MRFRPPIRGAALSGMLSRARNATPITGRDNLEAGEPQHELVRLVNDGMIRGSVLEVESGLGENALYLAKEGFEVWGIDRSRRAIASARAQAANRNLSATFLVWNPLALARIGRQFDTVIDFGNLRRYRKPQRVRYVAGLHAVTKSGGTCYLLCVSEHDDSDRYVTTEEILDTFTRGWTVESIQDTILETAEDGPRQAYLVRLTRNPPTPPEDLDLTSP